jgi:hypothetical protein
MKTSDLLLSLWTGVAGNREVVPREGLLVISGLPIHPQFSVNANRFWYPRSKQ